MGVYVDSLKEDLKRVRKNMEAYQIRINDFPVGSLMVRKIKGHEYIYLKYREGNKVIQKYVSCYDPEQYKQIQSQIQQRRKIEKELRDLAQEEKEMKKALKALGEKHV